MGQDNSDLIRVTVRLTRAQKRKLEVESGLLHMSMSELIRQVFFGYDWREHADDATHISS